MFEYQIKKNNNTQIIQRLMNKLGKTKDDYKKYLRSRVVLYAELDGAAVGPNNGLFESNHNGHAEENLLAYLKTIGKTSGHLKIYLSTSPCSSEFGTRTDDNEGCIEQLKQSGFNVEVICDHLYQPEHLRSLETKANGFHQGFSSESALFASKIPHNIEPGAVAQFHLPHSQNGRHV